MEERQTFQIKSSEFVLGNKIGGGAYGVVYEGYWQQIKVAIKQLRVEKLTPEAEAEFQKETKLMATLHHDNIIHFYGICTDKEPYSMVMQYMPRGSLDRVLAAEKAFPPEKRALSWQMRIQIGVDIGAGLTYLHNSNNKIIHQDLKSLNILLAENYCAKITDFGLSKVKHTTATLQGKQGGSFLWAAPEQLDEGSATFKSDVYSYGVVLWEISSFELPWQGYKLSQVLGKVLSGKRETIPPETPAVVKQAIESAWQADPEKRPTASELVTMLKSVLVEPLPTLTSSTFPPLSGAPSGPVYTDLQSGNASGQNVTTDSRYLTANPDLNQSQQSEYESVWLLERMKGLSAGLIVLKLPWEIETEGKSIYISLKVSSNPSAQTHLKALQSHLDKVCGTKVIASSQVEHDGTGYLVLSIQCKLARHPAFIEKLLIDAGLIIPTAPANVISEKQEEKMEPSRQVSNLIPKQADNPDPFFKPAPLTAHEEVTRMAASVAKQVAPKDIEEAFKALVQEGSLVKVKELLKKDKRLALVQQDVTYPSKQTFKAFTLLQCAAWGCDKEMWEIILEVLDRKQAALQLNALESRADILNTNGAHYSFDSLIAEYELFLKKSVYWVEAQNWKEMVDEWINNLSGKLRKLPIWVWYVFCEDGKDKAWPTKDLSKPVVRTNVFMKWWYSEHDIGWARGGRESAKWIGTVKTGAYYRWYGEEQVPFAHDLEVFQLMKVKVQKELIALRESLNSPAVISISPYVNNLRSLLCQSLI